ncbi:HAMP domain-containing histidine kinase [Chryseomicrobium palamuruense]
MKKERHLGKWITVGVLITLIVTTLLTWTGNRHEFLNDFQDTDSFHGTIDYEILERLGALLVEPLTEEELLAMYSVSSEDIEEYRFRYGNLNTQIQSIMDQYEPVEGQELGPELQEERDAKIADIRKNFSDDNYVSDKLEAEWERDVATYLANLKVAQRNYLSNYPGIGYSLTNNETGETFDREGSAGVKFTYGSDGRWLQMSRFDNYWENTVSLNEKVDAIYANYSGTVTIPNAFVGQPLQQYKVRQTLFWVLTVLGLLSVLGGVIAWRKWKQDLLASSLVSDLNSKPLEVRALFAGATLWIGYTITERVARGLAYSSSYQTIPILEFGFAVLFFTVFMILLISITQTIDDYSYETSLLKRWVEGLRGLFLNRSLAWQAIIILVIVFFWGFGTVLSGIVGGMILVWIPATVFIGIPALYFLFSRIAYLNRTMVQTARLSDGVVNEPFEIKGRSRLTEHAKVLNGLRDQLVTSQSSQVKSERLKSELITNVSHDLRTPLTSIITYTDLLKNPELTAEQREQYVGVLERKSARLKTLIEDLFDVSKMASGNIELHKTKVDVASLLQQAIAEQQEALDKQNLDVRVSIASQPVHAYMDGQKVWRVFDNLLLNISKYSMPGTRVYVALQETPTHAVVTFKNVSQYELGDDTAELTERFKRGDQARHTEGSGLGLAIAQSIVTLHNGEFDLSLDGDLFKVTILLPKGAM